uniref:C2 domain-containing protein n=1 Tax=Kalanchoe fedtschenkoi TaxID=63787 RepID=A0A7N0UGR1_KALFE
MGVLSVSLDKWSDEEIDSMIEVGGNNAANAVYEAFLPEGYSKPSPDAGNEERVKFIRSKYELQEFLKPGLRILSTNSGKTFQSDSKEALDGSNSLSHRNDGMIEYIGILKVKVVKGTNLAIKDMRSSDPYVVLTLGQQKVQTTVKKSDLNPVWNEELMLSVPDEYGSVKLSVYDEDTFSAHDIMGEAEIDIQPLITSAMALGDVESFESMQIGKWLKSDDNALRNDSIINLVDGKVKQDVLLKLQNVECGELELELEWIPLDP